MKPLFRIVVHPWFIALLNLGFVAISSLGLYDLIITHARPYHEAEDTIEGIGVILIAWGVVLEERSKISEVLGLVPDTSAGESPPHEAYEAAINENCHRYGLGILIFGLIAETVEQCVKIPDRVINTSGFESEVLLFSSIIIAIACLLMLRQIFFLLSKTKRSFPNSIQSNKPPAH